MCTLSIIPLAAGTRPPGLRLVINRDESESRPRALPPRWHGVGGVRAIWPTDPAGGGTWVAANEGGVAFAVLNRNLEPRPTLPHGLASRGEIIPSIVHAVSTRAAAALVRSMDLARFAPFRLVVSAVADDAAGAVVCTWDRRELQIEEAVAPLCLASSGLGDSVVQVRLPLFDTMVGGGVGVGAGGPSAGAQDAFHGHAWADRRALSVMMSRPGYRTVSVTAVEVRAREVRVDYREVRGEPLHAGPAPRRGELVVKPAGLAGKVGERVGA